MTVLCIFYIIFELIFNTEGMSHFKKIIKKIQFLLKSDNDNGYFITRDMYIYDNISPNSF